MALNEDAVGLGWYVDPTSAVDDEIEDLGGGILRARVGHAAGDRVDLLTVLGHELGHVLGLEHADNTDSLMSELLAPGVRHHRWSELVDQMFGGD